MKALRLGSQGDDVVKWKLFLIGQKLLNSSVSPIFDQETHEASKKFQSLYKLDPDGVVGNATIAQAMKKGFFVIEDDSVDKSGYNWPLPPSFSPLVGNEEREKVFGKFKFIPNPVPGNPESIKIIDDWVSQNIVEVYIPQLVSVKGAPKSGKIQIHKLISKQFVNLFAEWEKLGYMNLVKTWGGSFVPRFVRGSNTNLSNHSFGSAFDINVQWNPLGAIGPLVGKEGSVRELVPSANHNGFYWGGHYKNRPDAMHFEAAVIK